MSIGQILLDLPCRRPGLQPGFQQVLSRKIVATVLVRRHLLSVTCHKFLKT